MSVSTVLAKHEPGLMPSRELSRILGGLRVSGVLPTTKKKEK
jgi:hypothetical protein